MLQHDFFYGTESQAYEYIKIPTYLFEDEVYRKISLTGKLLYCFMLNRVSLSVKNGWYDDKNRLYIIFTIEQIEDELDCSNKKAIKLIKELETAGLIEKKKQGVGKPTLIYVMDFTEPIETE